MAYELVYTSAERGLRPGTRGFCTVAHTRGIAPAVVQILEAMSSYKSLYGVHEEQDADNPVAYSHYRSRLLGREASVLSRVCPIQADHTGRSNKLAHHVLLSAREYPAGGPIWLCRQEDFFLHEWQGESRFIELPKKVPVGESPCAPAATWAQVTGDAGYAAWLAASCQNNLQAVVYLVFNPGMPMLDLLGEAMALLEPSQRWAVTFKTYFTSLPAGMTCNWRCCLPEAEVLREGKSNQQAKILDLTGKLPPLDDSPLVLLAREGRSAQTASPAPPPSEPAAARKKFVLLPQRSINMLNLKPRKPEN